MHSENSSLIKKIFLIMDFEKTKLIKFSVNEDSILLVKPINTKKSKHTLIYISFLFIIFILIIIFTIIKVILSTIKDILLSYLTNPNILSSSLKEITVNNINSNLYQIDYYSNEEEKNEALKRGQIYFSKCIQGELIKNINNSIQRNENPLISIIIPVYNTNEKIKSVVRSSQNQNISNIEIILVNDFSNNETYKTILDLQKEDNRIECINNKKNMGTLYSRCIGTLKAKGKYIFPLDNDDLFFDEGLFDTITKEAENGNFDIVEFRGASREVYDLPPNKFVNTNYSNHQHGLILYQPELGLYARKRGKKYGVYDCFLWAKCIRNDIYKKTINYIGKNISHKIIWGEDLITSFVLFRVAKSFKFIGKYGIFRYLNLSTSTYHTKQKLIDFSKIIYLYIISFIFN